MTPRLYAWAHAVRVEEAAGLASMFPGLGLVLDGSNYRAAAKLTVPPIARVESIKQAETVAQMAWDGVHWHTAIIMDERNQTGPSGKYLTPHEYELQFNGIAPTLRSARVPVSTMGLAAKRSPWRDVLRCRAFDTWYHLRLPVNDLRAFNPNGVRRRELERALTHAERWILSPAPFRGWWDDLLSPIKVKGWARYATDERVHAVALWCLREHQNRDGWQVQHGLLDRHGRITRVGKAAQRVLA